MTQLNLIMWLACIFLRLFIRIISNTALRNFEIGFTAIISGLSFEIVFSILNYLMICRQYLCIFLDISAFISLADIHLFVKCIFELSSKNQLKFKVISLQVINS